LRMAQQLRIAKVKAREIFDSRGNPTVEVDLETNDGFLFRAAVPSGASTGVYEALELRDGGKMPEGLALPSPDAATRCCGKGVLRAVENVNTIISPKLKGMDVTEQEAIDRLMVEELDGSKNEWGWSKSKLGANAILGVSMAVCRAGAAATQMALYEYIAKLAKKPMKRFVLPVPAFNVINGGSHAGNRLACQEFMILPVGASSFKQAMVIGMEVYHTLKSCIKKKYGQDACNVGDEGGFAPSVQDNNEALDILMEAIQKSGHEDKVKIGTDVAASEFYDAETKKYDLDFKNPNGSSPDMKKSSAEMVDYYKAWISKYPLVSIEDPFDQDDWEAYQLFLSSVSKETQVVGDDLLVTNPTRVQKAIDMKACNALLLKVNQIGSVTEAIKAATMSQLAGYGVMVSHRSGETEDCFIADLAVGLASGQIKTGAPCRSERLSKYNQLIRIEEELGEDAVYAGLNFRQPLGAPRRVVVVGWGPVGHTVVEELLEKSQEKPVSITVLCEEPYAAYNRVKLTTYFEHRSPEKLAFAGEVWCKENGVNLVFGAATGIDRAARQVSYQPRKGPAGTVEYDDLVFTTGSKPFVPPIPGLSPDLPGLCVYRTIDDCVTMIERAKVIKKALVIGGGLLGLEAAKALYDLGLETTITEMAPHLMPVQVDPAGGALLQSKVEALGIKVYTAAKPLEVLSGPDGVTGLKISVGGSETVVEVGMICVCAGVRPRDELAKACGLEMGGRGGIKVNEQQQSSDEHIYAAGEVASIGGGMCYGLSAPGREQGKILVANLMKKGSVAYKGSDLSTKLKLLGVDLGSFGGTSSFWFDRQYCSDDPAKVKNLVTQDASKGIYKKLVFTPGGDKLLGGILIGDIADFAKLAAIAKKPNLGGLTPEQLLAGDIPVDDGGDGTKLAEDDLVCNCHCVPKTVIKKAILGGADTFAAIKKCTKAGTGCGTCISTGPMPKLLAFTLQKAGKSVGACPPCLPFPLQDIEDLCKARQLKNVEDVVADLAPPNAKGVEACRSVIQPLLDTLFNGKTKGHGLDLVGQLKAARKDMFEFINDQNCNPIMVRLAWHDSGTYDKTKTAFPDMGGANGSIIYAPEINHGANNGLNKAVNFLKPFKSDYPLISWADLIQMASAVAIEHAGGPRIDMIYGRADVDGPEACPGRTSRGTGDNAGLPDAEPPYGCKAVDAATHLRNIFHRMGFSDQEIVALSGAHTLGRAFKERSGTVPEGYGEANACPYTKAVGLCPVRHDGAAGVGMPGGRSWTKQWLKFDNSYFRDYVAKDPHLAWFSTDRALHEDPEFRKTFLIYKEDQAAFFKDYAAAHKKLSELGSKFSPDGGIKID